MPRLKVFFGGGWIDTNKSGAVDFGGDRLAFGPPSGGGSPVSLYPEVLTPTTVDAADGDASYSMGTWMKSTVPGTVTHIRWFFPTNSQPEGTQVLANAFRTLTAEKVGGEDVPFVGTNGTWNTVSLAAPFHVEANEGFCPAIWTPRRYVATGGFFGTGYSNPPLYTDAAAGKFLQNNNPLVSLPTDQFGQATYLVDCLFVPD